MLKLNEIKDRLKIVNVSKLAREIGIERGSVYHVFRAKCPNYYTVEKISDYIEANFERKVD